MNKKISLMAIAVTGVFLIAAFGYFSIAQTKSNDIQDISLKVSTEKESYIKGEPVKLRVEIINNGKTDIYYAPLHESRLWVSRDKKDYKFHDGAPADDVFFDFLVLKPGQTREAELLPFLWNGKPSYKHLGGETQSFKEADDKIKVTTEYVFQDAGTYYATVRMKVKDGEDRRAVRIEAAPAAVIIEEPVGDDLEVWKQIAGDIDIAFLMQRGRFSGASNLEKQNNLSRKIEQIIIDHPNSIYSEYLKTGMEKFKAYSEKQSNQTE